MPNNRKRKTLVGCFYSSNQFLKKETMTNLLNTSNDIYLVEFHAKSSGVIFNGGDTGVLGDLCKEFGKSGILQIRRYNASKMKFDKISKALVKQIFSWDTHSIIELQKTNFIK